MQSRTGKALLTALMAIASLGVFAQEDVIRKTLALRYPEIASHIISVRPTQMPGLYELNIEGDLIYSDARGDFIIQGGQLISTAEKSNLTEKSIERLNAIDFKSLPTQNAFTIVRGDGSRKLAVFQDPNCTYCKIFERDLLNVDNITIHMYLYPILGSHSVEQARNIWCAPDQGGAWKDTMIENRTVPAAECDSASATLNANLDFGRKHRITGTPTVIFADGTRIPGAVRAADIERRLQALAP